MKRNKMDFPEACFIRKRGGDKTILVTGIPGSDKDLLMSALSGLAPDNMGFRDSGSSSVQIHIEYNKKQIDLLSLPETYSLWQNFDGEGFTGDCFAFAQYDAFIIICKPASIAYGESLFAEASALCDEGYLCINNLKRNGLRLQLKRVLNSITEDKKVRVKSIYSDKSLKVEAEKCMHDEGASCKYNDCIITKSLEYEEIPLLSCFEFKNKAATLVKDRKLEVSGMKDIKRLKKRLFVIDKRDDAEGGRPEPTSDEAVSQINYAVLFEPLIAMLSGLNPDADPQLEALKFVLLAQEGVKLPVACFLPIQISVTRDFVMCVNQICNELNERRVRLKDCPLAVITRLKDN